MATFSQSTVDSGSDSIKDFYCSPCIEHKIDQWAEFYCNNCLKFYCAKCINLHDQLFGKHVTYGRGDTRKLAVSKEVKEFLQKCDIHDDKLLEMFCDDHSQLCCTNCAFLNHRLCANVTLISEIVKGPPPDLQQLSRKIQTIMEELEKLQNYWDDNMQFLQASYDEKLQEICQTRQKMNVILDNIEQRTMKELADKMTSLKSSLKTDADNCSKLKSDLKQLSGAIHEIVDKGKAELRFIASKKCLEKVKQSETYMKENSVQVGSSLNFQADSDVLQYLSGLGRIVLNTKALSVLDQVFILQGKSEYNVRITSDSEKTCHITAICVLCDDQTIVADTYNRRIKLLNHKYQVEDHCDLIGYPWDICQITPSEVAVTLAHDFPDTHEIQFVCVNGGQLVKGSKLQFQHACHGIAHDLQDLYLTSCTALYKYSMSGDLLNKLYEDQRGFDTVFKCAVSSSGEKIFVLNRFQHKVLTLARDGTVLHTFTDPDLECPWGVHVTALGQVLICGSASLTILQLDSEGKKKLETLVTERDEIHQPCSVYYNRSTSSIIVGQWYRNNIHVFQVK